MSCTLQRLEPIDGVSLISFGDVDSAEFEGGWHRAAALLGTLEHSRLLLDLRRSSGDLRAALEDRLSDVLPSRTRLAVLLSEPGGDPGDLVLPRNVRVNFFADEGEAESWLAES
jgi:hypothetical protein